MQVVVTITPETIQERDIIEMLLSGMGVHYNKDDGDIIIAGNIAFIIRVLQQINANI